ncbi:MAG TPA: hypothetical protein VMN60_08390 [Longimicrobiales bacterium]|nr:hypothetical protein [Longimicrobiales bacterium]
MRAPHAVTRLLRTSLALLVCAAPAAAQDRPTGIRVSGEYDVRQRPVIAVRPFAGASPIAEAIDSITRIVQRDLHYSDRYNMLDAVPEVLRAGDVDYAQWNGLRVTYLVTGDVTPTTRGYELRVTIHDVPWGRVVNDARFALPAATAPDFRMAVHAVSDDVVQRTVNAPGIAATRIALTRQNRTASGTQTYDLLLVDADGFGLRRIQGFGGQLYSPVWSPDGRRLLYTANREHGWELIERDIASGRERTIRPGGEMVSTPTYSRRDGEIAMALWQGNRNEITVYDLERQTARRISAAGRFDEQYPTYSFDGRWLAFNSTRLGRQAIFVASADGSNPSAVTPFQAGVKSEYAAPVFSPTDMKLAFHGHWNTSQSLQFQILIADAARPGSQITQLTSIGHNEDPSWAPDGRHLVYTATEVRGAPDGLYVVDSESKIRRLLASGGNMRMADWSPPLVRASDLVVR